MPLSQVARKLLARVCTCMFHVAQRHQPRLPTLAALPSLLPSLSPLQVSWLQLHNQPSPSCLLGLELVTAADFVQRFGFPPAAYPDWLALVGASCLQGWLFATAPTWMLPASWRPIP